MNSKQMQFAIVLSQTLNFSQAAQQLNMTQSALSKQIMALEKELGVKLFDRTCSPVSLTPAGETFVRQAQELIYQEKLLLQTMTRYSTGESGRLVIGISPFRSLYLMPDLIHRLQEKYPGIQVELQETNSTQLRKNAAEGAYDFAIVNLPVEDSLLDITPLEPDTLVLAVPNALASTLPCEADCNALDFAQCKELPFVVVSKSQELRQLFEKLCAGAGFLPHITAEVVGLSTAWAMVQAGVGASLLPLQFLTADKYSSGLKLFTLKDNPYSRQPVIVTRRGRELPDYAQYAIDLLTGR